MAAPVPLTSLTEEERAQAQARFEVLRPCLEGGVPLARVARQQGVNQRTAQRWAARYRQHGLAGLADRPRADRGGYRSLPPDQVRLIEGLALRRPPPTAAFVHRQVAAVAARHGWRVPSYRTVARVIARLDPALLALAHEGTAAVRETFDLLYRREAARPNEVWQADHTPLNVWLLDERGRPARPWLTVILDDYSRLVTGFGLSFHAPSVLQTALVLRRAIWRKGDPRWHACGIPDVFYTDHGSDFTSRHLEQVAADLKMQLVFSQVGVPRGRGKIERFFQTIDQLFLCGVPGYTPEGAPPAAPTLTLAAFEPLLQAFLLDTYHQRVHGETGMAPQARWTAGGFLPRLPTSLEQLDLLLLTVATPRRVHQDGIRFQGFRYFDLTLAGYVGEDVIIRYDPRDLAEVRVYHHQAFVCRAVCHELAGQTVSLKEVVQARTQRRRQLREQLDDRTTAVDLLLAVHRPPPTLAPSPAPPLAVGPRLKRYENE